MQQFVKRAQGARRASLVPAGHQHTWLRRRGSVGLFRCANCAASAICPECYQSIDLALLVQSCVDHRLGGLVLCWCPRHQRPGVELVPASPSSARRARLWR